MVKRPPLNLMIDTLAAFLFLGMVATGWILHWTMPPGTNKSLELWGLTRHQWGSVHAWISLTLLVTLSAHVALHWSWVVTMFRREFGSVTETKVRNSRSGVITLIVCAIVFGVFAAIASLSVRDRNEPCCTDSPDKEVANANTAPEAASANGWAAVQNVLRESCLACHGPSLARGGFRVDQRDDFFARGRSGPLVIPHDSGNSPLIAIVSGQRPDIPLPDRHRLKDQDIKTLAQWIDSGAMWGDNPE